jgi:serine/threonine-protein kinase TNNI3K
MAEEGARSLVAKQPYRNDKVTLQGRLGTTVSGQAIIMRGQLAPATAVVVKVFYGGHIGAAAFDKEKSVMDRLGRSHANIMTYHKAIAGALPAIVYPLMRGSLDAQLEDCALSGSEARRYGGQVASALRHMHQQRVAHFDLKAANILVDHDGTAKLGDFGLAVFVGSDDSKTLSGDLSASHLSTLSANPGGTVPYMAPEVLDGKMGDRIKPFKNDVYGFGILLWELHSGNVPYTHLDLVPGENRSVTIHKAVKRGQRPEPIGAKWDADMVGLMRRCWAANAGARPSIAEVCSALGV